MRRETDPARTGNLAGCRQRDGALLNLPVKLWQRRMLAYGASAVAMRYIRPSSASSRSRIARR
jgi:hypothetical protein